MERTPLETFLDEQLPLLGFKLFDRVYADDLDFQANIEDAMSKVKPEDLHGEDKLFALVQGDISYEQAHRGIQTFINRFSSLRQGLGFEYSIEIGLSTYHGKTARESADELIRKRDFGDGGAEALKVYYSPDIMWKSFPKRAEHQLLKEFYNALNEQLSLTILSDSTVRIKNWAREENGYEGAYPIRAVLEGIEHDFPGKKFDADCQNAVRDYLKQLVLATE